MKRSGSWPSSPLAAFALSPYRTLRPYWPFWQTRRRTADRARSPTIRGCSTYTSSSMGSPGRGIRDDCLIAVQYHCSHSTGCTFPLHPGRSFDPGTASAARSYRAAFCVLVLQLHKQTGRTAAPSICNCCRNFRNRRRPSSVAFALAQTKSPAEAGDRTFTRWSFSGSGSVGRPDHLDHHPAGRASVGPGAADRPAGRRRPAGRVSAGHLGHLGSVGRLDFR